LFNRISSVHVEGSYFVKIPPKKRQGIVKKEEDPFKNELEEKINTMKVDVDEVSRIAIEWSDNSTLHACLA
jgi:hypothetical protein